MCSVDPVTTWFDLNRAGWRFFNRHNTPTTSLPEAEDIVYALGDKGFAIRSIRMSFVDWHCMCERSEAHDERTGLNGPLVYRLWHLLKRRVAMFGRDKR